jgi:hypothetical protein
VPCTAAVGRDTLPGVLPLVRWTRRRLLLHARRQASELPLVALLGAGLL